MAEITGNETGPIFNVPLINSMPVGETVLLQAMPTRADLEQTRQFGDRVAAGYEALLWHYLGAIGRLATKAAPTEQHLAARVLDEKSELEKIKADFVEPGPEMGARIDSLPLHLWLEANVFVCDRLMDRYSDPNATRNLLGFKMAQYQKHVYERVLERLRIEGAKRLGIDISPMSLLGAAKDESAADQSEMPCPVCKEPTSEHLGKHLCSNLDCDQYGCDVSSGPVPLKDQLKVEYRATLKTPAALISQSDPGACHFSNSVSQQKLLIKEQTEPLHVREGFERDLCTLLNRYGIDAKRNMPDFELAARVLAFLSGDLIAEVPPPSDDGIAFCDCFQCVETRGHFTNGWRKHSRMILCDLCGNKRCPRATNHVNPCSGSNEPGQPGSRYKSEPPPSGAKESEAGK